jgi:hypothetical protein
MADCSSVSAPHADSRCAFVSVIHAAVFSSGVHRSALSVAASANRNPVARSMSGMHGEREHGTRDGRANRFPRTSHCMRSFPAVDADLEATALHLQRTKLSVENAAWVESETTEKGTCGDGDGHKLSTVIVLAEFVVAHCSLIRFVFCLLVFPNASCCASRRATSPHPQPYCVSCLLTSAHAFAPTPASTFTPLGAAASGWLLFGSQTAIGAQANCRPESTTHPVRCLLERGLVWV